MNDTQGAIARRARRLLLCYPRAWRMRYGEEFLQLLIDDMSERPRSVTRTADVVRTGLLARLAGAGLIGDEMRADRQAHAGLAAVGCALSVFLVLAVAIWAQLTIGWQWSAPSAPATRAAMLLMSGVMVVFVALALLGMIPIAWTLCRAFVRGRARSLASPVSCAAAATTVLVLGSIHFGHGWPGTGGHAWAGRDIVPGAVARACWAATLWISSYWAHPAALASFPASEIAWMVVSPIAVLALLTAVAITLRRLELSPRVLRYESWLGMAAALAMAAFLAGAGSWVVSAGPQPRGLFRVGAIDSIGITVMAAALMLAFRSARRALVATRIASSTR